jgi:Glycoside hydrolase 123, catalytic domain/Glycoside hydrolase 123 N-terminal domain
MKILVYKHKVTHQYKSVDILRTVVLTLLVFCSSTAEPQDKVLASSTNAINQPKTPGLTVSHTSSPTSTTSSTGFAVWTAPSLSFIDKNAAPASMPTSVHIYAAKGEYESFQIGIRAPAGGLTNINIVPAALVNANGELIDVTMKTLYREHYVYINKVEWGGTNKSLGPGWYPDGLIPFADPTTGADLTGVLDAVPFALSENQNAAIWVDILVPRAAASGNYQGSLTVTSSQGNVSVPVTLTVWNFTLPVRPGLLSSFSHWRTPTLPIHQELLRNRVAPESVSPSDERSLIDDYGLNATNIGFYSGASYHNCNMSIVPSFSSITNEIAQHQKDLFLYAYSADIEDNCSNLFSTIIEWAKNIHRANTSQLITVCPNPSLFDDGLGSGRSAVDIWVVLPMMYDRCAQYANQAIAKGDEVWSYNTGEQDPFSPKWVIGYTPINFRVQPGFINQSLGLTGILYWEVDHWSSDQWNKVAVSNTSPGEGVLVYPGAEVGLPGTAVASMRLKWIRDGVDDYDYIKLLKDAGQGTFALEISKQVGADWHNWTRDAALLETKRIELGNKLSQP